MPPIDLSTLPICTQEDGSDPGQVLPCHWDANVQGNGQGLSFTLTEASGVPLYDATPVVTSEPAPEPLTVPLSPANEVLAAPLTASSTAQDVAPAPELAHTGPTDPIMWALAALMVTLGAVLAPIGKRGRRRSS